MLTTPKHTKTPNLMHTRTHISLLPYTTRFHMSLVTILIILSLLPITLLHNPTKMYPYQIFHLLNITKVDFPKFNGEDLRVWLYKVEQLFTDEDLTIQQKMKLVSLHFEGDTLQWHLGYVKKIDQLPLPTWEEYLWLCDSFGAEYSDPKIVLMNIKHTRSLKEFQKAFDNAMTRINLSVEHAISIFLNNLKPTLSTTVRIGNPCSLP